MSHLFGQKGLLNKVLLQYLCEVSLVLSGEKSTVDWHMRAINLEPTVLNGSHSHSVLKINYSTLGEKKKRVDVEWCGEGWRANQSKRSYFREYVARTFYTSRGCGICWVSTPRSERLVCVPRWIWHSPLDWWVLYWVAHPPPVHSISPTTFLLLLLLLCVCVCFFYFYDLWRPVTQAGRLSGFARWWNNF